PPRPPRRPPRPTGARPPPCHAGAVSISPPSASVSRDPAGWSSFIATSDDPEPGSSLQAAPFGLESGAAGDPAINRGDSGTTPPPGCPLPVALAVHARDKELEGHHEPASLGLRSRLSVRLDC